jgi:hypothetical protein
VAHAARQLGISERAIRWRIQRGSLPARRDGARWLVQLPVAIEGGSQGGSSAVVDEHSTVAALVKLTEAKDQRILELAGQVGFLQATRSSRSPSDAPGGRFIEISARLAHAAMTRAWQ